MAATIYARSLPYRTTPTRQRICDRCGIQYRLSHTKRDGHNTRCIDCRNAK